MEDPADLLEQVVDRESFLAFVRALIADRVDEVEKERVQPSSSWDPGANGWENDTIEQYLFAALRWAEATHMGETQGLPAGPSWRAFAAFLYCGKIYEWRPYVRWVTPMLQTSVTGAGSFSLSLIAE